MHNVAQRSARLFAWLQARPEREIVVVSHAAFLRSTMSFGPHRKDLAEHGIEPLVSVFWLRMPSASPCQPGWGTHAHTKPLLPSHSIQQPLRRPSPLCSRRWSSNTQVGTDCSARRWASHSPTQNAGPSSQPSPLPQGVCLGSTDDGRRETVAEECTRGALVSTVISQARGRTLYCLCQVRQSCPPTAPCSVGMPSHLCVTRRAVDARQRLAALLHAGRGRLLPIEKVIRALRSGASILALAWS